MRSHQLKAALALVSAVVFAAACSRQAEPTAPATPATPRVVTYSHDIAPILFTNCASCHRPIDDGAGVRAGSTGEDPLCVAGAPFSVLDYDSARRHAREIASAVQRRAMPPWLPEPGHAVFAGERRL